MGKYIFVALYTISINPFYTIVFQNINGTLHAIGHTRLDVLLYFNIQKSKEKTSFKQDNYIAEVECRTRFCLNTILNKIKEI